MSLAAAGWKLLITAAIAALQMLGGLVLRRLALLRAPSIPSAEPSAPNQELSMFRISQVLQKVVGAFKDIANSIEAGAAQIYAHLPVEAQAMIQQDVVIAKQFASDALGKVDGALANHQKAIAMAVEEAADTELALLTGGKSIEFNSFTNAGIDEFVATGVAAFHNWALSTKARLAAATPTPTVATPPAS